MSRVVVLEFKNNSMAEEFVRDASPGGDLNHPDIHVVGIVARPTKYCTCQLTKSRHRKKDEGWTRGTTFGWMVCSTCHLPSERVVSDWHRWFLNDWRNLLPDILGTPREGDQNE